MATNERQPFAMIPTTILHAALSQVGHIRGAVLASVWEQIYGPAKAESAVIHCRAIAARFGVDESQVRRAIGKLRDDGVIVKVGRERYVPATPDERPKCAENRTHPTTVQSVRKTARKCAENRTHPTTVSLREERRERKIQDAAPLSSEASERGREPAPRPAAAGGVKVVRSEDRDALVELVALHWTDDFAERKFRRELPPILRAARGDVRIVEAAVKSASENDAADPVAWIVAKCRDYAEAGVPEDVAPTKNDTMSEAEAAAWKEILRGVGA